MRGSFSNLSLVTVKKKNIRLSYYRERRQSKKSNKISSQCSATCWITALLQILLSVEYGWWSRNIPRKQFLFKTRVKTRISVPFFQSRSSLSFQSRLRVSRRKKNREDGYEKISGPLVQNPLTLLDDDRVFWQYIRQRVISRGAKSSCLQNILQRTMWSGKREAYN